MGRFQTLAVLSSETVTSHRQPEEKDMFVIAALQEGEVEVEVEVEIEGWGWLVPMPREVPDDLSGVDIHDCDGAVLHGQGQQTAHPGQQHIRLD